jgi:CelD/BcsL family acetyltransferase involved in cellulose biosynthesis
LAELSIEEVNDIETYSSLGERWDALLQKSSDNNIFLTWEWLFIWWRHYGEGKQLRILLIKEQDKIIGIVPMMQWQYKKGPFHINLLENICAEECDYSGAILTERVDESVAILLKYLQKITSDSKTIVRIWHVPERSNFLSVLRKEHPVFIKSLILNERLSSQCPYIDLPTTREEYFQTLGKRTREHIRRRAKYLENDFTVEFKKYTGDEDLQSMLENLFLLHQERWQARNIVSKFQTPQARGFYVEVSEVFHQKGWLNLSFVNINGRIASIEWGFNYDRTYWSMTFSFDIDYSRYSLGRIHSMYLIQDAINNGQRKFDMLKGIEDYKSHYAKNKASNMLITLSHNNLKGKIRVISLNILMKFDNMRVRSIRENLGLLLDKIRSRTSNPKS